MVADISAVTRAEVLGAIRSRYREASRKDKRRVLDEFVAIAGCHRKHAVRLLGRCNEIREKTVPNGQRIYDVNRQELSTSKPRNLLLSSEYVTLSEKRICHPWLICFGG